MVTELWLFFYRHARWLNWAHIQLLAKEPLRNASISAAAGNSQEMKCLSLSSSRPVQVANVML